jgi:uncharacterized protein
MDLLNARAPWFIAGPLIGLLVVLLFWVDNKPFGALGGYIELTEWLGCRRSGAGWRTFFTVGIVAGGLVSALGGAGVHATFTYGSFDRLFGASLALKGAVLGSAGLFMGLGGRLAGGCTSGHGICGASLGSGASLVSTATFMATAIAIAHAVAWLVESGS